MAPTSRAAEQIVFRWDPNGIWDAPGVGPVASSCTAELTGSVFHDLGPVIRAEGQRGRASVARLSWREWAVLLRRDPSRDPSGRPNTVSTMLLADPDLLGPEVGLAMLHPAWKQLADPATEVTGHLRPLDQMSLWRLVEKATPDFEDAVHEVTGPLATALAALIRIPDRRLWIQDRSRGSQPPWILWGLHQLLDDTLGELTFSTYETAASWPFRLAFGPDWPSSAAHDPRLSSLDLDTVHSDVAQRVAGALVASYQLDPGSYRCRLRELPLLADLNLKERVHQLSKLIPRDLPPAPPPRAVPHGEPTRAADPRAETQWSPAVPSAEPEPAPAYGTLASATAVSPPARQEPDRPPSAEPADHRDRAAAPEPHSLDSYIPPSVSSLRRVIGRTIRWFRPRPATPPALERQARERLQSLTELDRRSHRDPLVARQLGQLDSKSLLSCLVHPETIGPLAQLLLAELADRSLYWSAAEADAVLSKVVSQRLYVAQLRRWRSPPPEPADGGWHGGPATAQPDPPRLQDSVALPVSIFDWAVRPRLRRRLRRRKAAALLDGLIHELLAEPSPDGRRIAVALVLDERPLPLTQATWRALLEQVLEPPLLPEPRHESAFP